MKLKNAKVLNFRCVMDSGSFGLGQITCLVGKNESGKTSLLKALERFNPVDDSKKRKFTLDLDWPRTAYGEFQDNANVLELEWALDEEDISKLEDELGKNAVRSSTIKVTVNYKGEAEWKIDLDEKQTLTHLFHAAGLDESERSRFNAATEVAQIPGIVEKLQQEAKSPRIESLLAKAKAFRDHQPKLKATDILETRVPRLLYFDSYDRMTGKVSFNKLREDRTGNRVSRNDQIFLNFLEHAQTSLDEVASIKNSESFFGRFEGASNTITRKIFKYWRQNKHLGIKFSMTEGLTDDQPPFNVGRVFHTRIENRLHNVTVNFDERSAGFTWFFSFLVQFALIKKKHGNVIILLDEPGLNLHGKAQGDLLRYITQELMPHHQVVYTTHSPFMVPPDHLEWVRTVEDVLVLDDSGNPTETKGTKVGQNVMATDADTLFPLQAALGYEITQSLFIGPNNLLVEGPGDVVYLTIASNALKLKGSKGIDSRWTMVPTGGIDKIGAFVSLFTGKNLNNAVLTDYATGQKAKVDALRKSEILDSSHVFTVPEIVGGTEGDIEDFWGAQLFCRIVNGAYSLSGSLALEPSKLPDGPRILKRIEAVFNSDAAYPEFSHYQPADWLMRNPDFLSAKEPDVSNALARFQAFFDRINALL